MKKIIRNKLFLFSYLADVISNFGDTLYYLALMNYVLFLPDTKFALAMMRLLKPCQSCQDFLWVSGRIELKTNWIPY